jgi:hypothetical protein
VSQFPMGWLKKPALSNMEFMLTTRPVFQFPMGWLK